MEIGEVTRKKLAHVESVCLSYLGSLVGMPVMQKDKKIRDVEALKKSHFFL